MQRAFSLIGLIGLIVSFSPAGTAGTVPSKGPDIERITIETRDDIKIVADYYVPRKKGARSPGALLIHDAGGNRLDLALLAERMWKRGFAVLVPDLRGHGENRTEESNWSKLDPEEQKRLWAFATRDIEAASRWLSARKEVHSTSLSMLGWRAGSALAVRHAVRDENVRCLALIEPSAEIHGFDIAETLHELGGLPTFIVSHKETSSEAKNMVEAAHDENNGHPYIELMVCRSQQGASLSDRKLAGEISRWIAEKAIPKRSARG